MFVRSLLLVGDSALTADVNIVVVRQFSVNRRTVSSPSFLSVGQIFSSKPTWSTIGAGCPVPGAGPGKRDKFAAFSSRSRSFPGFLPGTECASTNVLIRLRDHTGSQSHQVVGSQGSFPINFIEFAKFANQTYTRNNVPTSPQILAVRLRSPRANHPKDKGTRKVRIAPYPVLPTRVGCGQGWVRSMA